MHDGISAVINRIRLDKSFYENITAWESVSSRSPEFQSIPDTVDPVFVQALLNQGITELFSHQKLAYKHVIDGENIIVSTGTASGKSLCYSLPVINSMIKDPECRALFLFPTKALSQDQFNSLSYIARSIKEEFSRDTDSNGRRSLPDIPLAVYDGDTPTSHRANIRNKARIIFTNPDMLHMGILPQHTNWADFFKCLKYIVIDEVHTYRGVFGSHLANVIRRLRRILDFYRSDPQFILASATIANPLEFAEKLVEQKFVLINQDGSRRGSQDLLLYNPPIIDQDLGLRKSSIMESIRIADLLLTNDVQSIVFCRSRPSVELLLSYLVQSQVDVDDASRKIRGYRSGYLPAERREIEEGLRSGKLKTVIATNALELGIDIGGVDATVLVGYPGTIASTRQQSGRAGRGILPSLSVLVLTPDPIDQFFSSHPEYLFGKNPEAALINPDNLIILLDHMRCSLFELPFEPGQKYGSIDQQTILELIHFLVESGDVFLSGNKYFFLSDRYPAQSISLRNSSADQVILQEAVLSGQGGQRTIIGQVDFPSAFWMTHPGAVYLHEAKIYLVEDLDLEEKVCRLRKVDPGYYTRPRRDTQIKILDIDQQDSNTAVMKGFGDLQVTTRVIGYRKMRWHTHEQMGMEELDLPPTELKTTGYWITLQPQLVNDLRKIKLWNNDPNNYGSDWDIQKKKAQARDGNQCQVCGSSGEYSKLEVHHKTPFRLFSSTMIANDLSNLVTLCGSCHHQVEMNVRIRSGLSGLANILGNLSPLFLMCDSNDIWVHSDPKPSYLDGFPTVIIYEEFTGGFGFSEHLYSKHDELVHHALELVKNCQCKDGCPSCVGPGGENGSGSKTETLAILEVLVQHAFT